MNEDVPALAPPSAGSPTADRLALFRGLVMADPSLQLELSQRYDPVEFAELAVRRAGEHGLDLDAASITAQVRPDPLGVSRWLAQTAASPGWPGRDWLPIHLEMFGQPYVDWAHFAGARLTEPFFELSRRGAASLPFNGMFHQRTGLREFLAAAADFEPRQPRGLIFHMSRCGSTLVAQMLAAVARHSVISEAPPLDTAVQLESAEPERCGGVVAAMASALGRRRLADDQDFFIKLDSWHTVALPLFRRVFPDTPWVFLYRDPLEVIVSQKNAPGIHTVPGLLPPHVLGVDPARFAHDEYLARVLARPCEAAAHAFGDGGGLLVNYDELPGAVWTRILPHFGVATGDEDRARMLAAAGRNAKSPTEAFRPDGEAKRRAATAEISLLAERCIGPSFRRLESLREAQP